MQEERDLDHLGRFGIAQGFSMEPRQIMANARVFTFRGPGYFLRLAEKIFRNDFLVNFPAVGENGEKFWIVRDQSSPERFERFGAARTNFEREEPPGSQRYSSPYP